MNGHPKKWIAAFAAVLLALCGIVQNVLAQAPAPAEVPEIQGRTYVFEEEGLVIVVRLKRQNQTDGVYGSVITSIFRTTDPSVPFVTPITGTLSPTRNEVRALWRLPRKYEPATADGTRDPIRDEVNITLRYVQDGRPIVLRERTLQRYNESLLGPYMPGTWYWSAATSPALLASAPPYTGTFHVVGQLKDGNFVGEFGKTNPGDVGEVTGSSSASVVRFTRSGTDANGVAFSQIWTGKLSEDGQTIQGTIEQPSIPSPWSGVFTAHWLPPPGKF